MVDQEGLIVLEILRHLNFFVDLNTGKSRPEKGGWG